MLQHEQKLDCNQWLPESFLCACWDLVWPFKWPGAAQAANLFCCVRHLQQCLALALEPKMHVCGFTDVCGCTDVVGCFDAAC